MLEPDAVKVARPVLRRGGGSNLSFLFDNRHYGKECIHRSEALHTVACGDISIKIKMATNMHFMA
ncbi:Uncharacterised protein [uncultured archaeon]|nr:Uncharacterised protein [uncultured archaeon]